MAVIIILAVIALIATPIVLNVIENSRKESNKNSTYGILDAAKLYYTESMLDTTKTGVDGRTNLLDVVSITGQRPDSGTLYIADSGLTAIAVVYGDYCFKKEFNETDLTETTTDNCSVLQYVYKERILNGTEPVINNNLIAVTISIDGTVKKANLRDEWYSYANKKWANAVILVDESINYNDGDTIPESNIESYFVWIPRYKYRIFNDGNYTTTISGQPSESSKPSTIEIVFENKSTAASTGSTVGEYLTHPAFTSMDINGFWVGKFETTGSSSNITVKPSSTSLRNLNVKTMFELAYNYQRSLDSHMLKNTEWGAVSYLSYSQYGINDEININNNSSYLTGYSAVDGTDQSSYPGTNGTDSTKTLAYNTTTGYKASTTGNITGVYDMSGGAWEYVSAYIQDTYKNSGFDASSIALYDTKYFDVYPSSTITSYNNRILGDATGEIGPFYNYQENSGSHNHNSWFGDGSNFVDSSYPWFGRGGANDNGVLAGSFHFSRNTGVAYGWFSFRLALVG